MAGKKKPWNKKTYRCWYNMKHRCDNEKDKDYHSYGGRGITYDPRWVKIENFYNDLGNIPERMTLDRINTNYSYYKENCRFSTRLEQLNNVRRNVKLELFGVKRSISAWAKIAGTSHNAIRRRVFDMGWDLTRAIVSHPLPQTYNLRGHLNGNKWKDQWEEKKHVD